MGEDRTTESSTRIAAPIAKVWEAVTTPEVIKRWFFGVDTETDWNVGSSIVHRGEYEGKPYEDKGTILEIDPPTRLVHTHWSPVSGLDDREENYQRVTWSLTERDGGTELTITEVNLPSEDMKAVSEQGWVAVLKNLKELLEG